MFKFKILQRRIVAAISFCCLMTFATASDPVIEGRVQVGPRMSLPAQGVLFVFARSKGTKSGPPAAVLRLVNPTFPVSFSLGPQNAMIPGIPFQGPFEIVARFSPSGDVMQKKGSFEGHAKSKSGVKAGEKNIQITIDQNL